MSRIKAGDIFLDVEVLGDGYPLLMIMGLGMDKRGWMLQTPHFMKKFKTIVFDNRGVGKSDVPQGPYSTELMAEDAYQLLRALNISRAHVVGISMGGMIAQQLALLHPEVIEKLVLVCTYCHVSPEIKEVTRNLTEAILGPGKSLFQADLSKLSFEQIIKGFVDVVFTPAFLKENRAIIEGFYQEFLKENPSIEGFFYQLVATQNHNTLDQLGSIQHPTLILHGEEDRLIPPSASEEIARKIPNSQLKWMADTGHALNFEKPQEFNKTIEQFLLS